MAAQLTDVLYAERLGIGGTITVQEIVSLAGGSLPVYTAQIDLGDKAKFNHTINIIDPNVNITSKVKVEFNYIDEMQYNDLEFDEFNFKTTCFNGSFNLFVFSNSRINKKININYTIQ